MAATILGSSMALIDGTVVNVALASLAVCTSRHAAGRSMVESYALFLAALLLVGGALRDLYGGRKVFAVGVAVFSAASAVCGCSPDIRWLIVARGVQGVGGALLVPGSLALISANFSEDAPRPRYRNLVGVHRHRSGITGAYADALAGRKIALLPTSESVGLNFGAADSHAA